MNELGGEINLATREQDTFYILGNVAQSPVNPLIDSKQSILFVSKEEEKKNQTLEVGLELPSLWRRLLRPFPPRGDESFRICPFP